MCVCARSIQQAYWARAQIRQSNEGRNVAANAHRKKYVYVCAHISMYVSEPHVHIYARNMRDRQTRCDHH